MKKKLTWIIVMILLIAGCNTSTEKPKENKFIYGSENSSNELNGQTEKPDKTTQEEKTEERPEENNAVSKEEPLNAPDLSPKEDGYKVIEVPACSTNGYRESNAKVDIGYGDREYWAYTNEHGQLVRVTAKKIVLQNDSTEEVTSDGRYCKDEAKVPGTENPELDEGHIIADSLGGVSNAYNITPQNSTLNRHGDQAYMEKVIRDAGGCTDFEAIITYPNTKTQIPSHYKYTYTLLGNVIVDEFDNVNPDNSNSESNQKPKPSKNPVSKPSVSASVAGSVWISASGSKYHNKNNCGTMNPDTAIQMTQAEAESKGYEACKRCY